MLEEPNHSLMTRADAAAYLDVKPQTLAAWATSKRYDLPFVKVGRLVRYRKQDLDAFINARCIGMAGAHQ